MGWDGMGSEEMGLGGLGGDKMGESMGNLWDGMGWGRTQGVCVYIRWDELGKRGIGWM